MTKNSTPLYLTDSHIHVGQFYHIYTSPDDLLRMMDNIGVNHFAASSTSICEGDYGKVLREMRELSGIAQGRLHAVLWIIPSMLTDGGLERFLNSGIDWECLKIHPQLNPGAWGESESYLNEVTSLAKSMKIPLLIHTGEAEGCYPIQFQQAIADNPEILFILAHSRPLDQTINLMERYSNVWADTAFVPVDNIVKLCNAGLSSRVLWGTDYPIPKYYYENLDMTRHYTDIVEALQASICQEDFSKITYSNFAERFGLEQHSQTAPF